MDSDDAEEVNLITENKYVKDAKVGEGTYAVVYSGKHTDMMHWKNKLVLTLCSRYLCADWTQGGHQKDQNGPIQRRTGSNSNKRSEISPGATPSQCN